MFCTLIVISYLFFVEYLDFGDMNHSCKYCHATFWYQERSEKTKKPRNPDFSMCCMKGKVALPILDDPPKLLSDLLDGTDSRSKHFLENIRTYNSMFAFTSIGGMVESALNNGGGPPQFVLSGQNYHRIGSLLPETRRTPKFAQLYTYDTQNEVNNREHYFG